MTDANEPVVDSTINTYPSESSYTQWILFSAVCIISLMVTILSIAEGRHITSMITKGEELSHGQQIRRWFVYAIAIANGCRTISLIVSSICYIIIHRNVDKKYPTHSSSDNSNSNSSISSSGSYYFALMAPSLLYFTMYSLLTIYFAQLCYAVRGISFSMIRNLWFVLNLFLYLIVLYELLVEEHVPIHVHVHDNDNDNDNDSKRDIITLTIAVATGINLILLSWFSVNVFKYFPSSNSSSNNNSNSSSNSNNNNNNNNSSSSSSSSSISSSSSNFSNLATTIQSDVKKIVSKLFPLLVTCLSGLCMELIFYSLLYMNVIEVRGHGQVQGHHYSHNSVGTYIMMLLSEILPSLVFLCLLSKGSAVIGGTGAGTGGRVQMNSMKNIKTRSFIAGSSVSGDGFHRISGNGGVDDSDDNNSNNNDNISENSSLLDRAVNATGKIHFFKKYLYGSTSVNVSRSGSGSGSDSGSINVNVNANAIAGINADNSRSTTPHPVPVSKV